MATISTLSVALTADTSPFKKKMQDAGGDVRGLRGIVATAGRDIASTFASIGLAAEGMRTVVSAIKSVVGTPLTLAASAEQTAVAFEVLLGSAQSAQTVLNEIKEFAASTPFQFPDLTDAGKKLIAFGTSGNQIVPTLRRLGELSAGLNIPIGDLADIYGKARVQGTLFMEDINQLAGRGIPIQTELAKIFNVTASEVRNLVSSGRVNFGHLEQAFRNLTEEGGKFQGLIQKQSETLGGVWSTLKDNVTASFTKIGTSIADGLNLKSLVTRVTSWVQHLAELFEIMAQDWSVAWEIMGLKARSVMAQVRAVVRSESENFGESTEGFIRGLVQGVQRFGFFGIRMSDNHWLNEADRNTRIEGLQTQQRTILERSDRAGAVSEEDAAAFRRIQAEIDKLQGINTAFGREVHESRKQWNKAANAAAEAAKPFEEELARRWQELRDRFQQGKEAVGLGGAADSKQREMEARAANENIRSAPPGLLESRSVEAFRQIAKWNQPRTEKVQEQQLAELRRIGDALDAPVEAVEAS